MLQGADLNPAELTRPQAAELARPQTAELARPPAAETLIQQLQSSLQRLTPPAPGSTPAGSPKPKHKKATSSTSTSPQNATPLESNSSSQSQPGTAAESASGHAQRTANDVKVSDQPVASSRPSEFSFDKAILKRAPKAKPEARQPMHELPNGHSSGTSSCNPSAMPLAMHSKAVASRSQCIAWLS